MAVTLMDDSNIEPETVATLHVYLAGNRKAMLQRDVDILTPAELRQHQDLADAGILEELRVWVQHNCVARAWRKHARNVMTSRFVPKWKSTRSKNCQMTRIIRMRMALRGFQDLDKDYMDTYAGTARRQSQRLVASEWACRSTKQKLWKACAVDVEKAFLQGMT